MKIVSVEMTAAKNDQAEKEENGYGITNKEKGEFFKLYTVLSKRAKNFVGRKRDSKIIKSNWATLLKAMRELVELDNK